MDWRNCARMIEVQAVIRESEKMDESANGWSDGWKAHASLKLRRRAQQQWGLICHRAGRRLNVSAYHVIAFDCI